MVFTVFHDFYYLLNLRNTRKIEIVLHEFEPRNYSLRRWFMFRGESKSLLSHSWFLSLTHTLKAPATYLYILLFSRLKNAQRFLASISHFLYHPTNRDTFSRTECRMIPMEYISRKGLIFHFLNTPNFCWKWWKFIYVPLCNAYSTDKPNTSLKSNVTWTEYDPEEKIVIKNIL